jgi:hypothetical protein
VALGAWFSPRSVACTGPVAIVTAPPAVVGADPDALVVAGAELVVVGAELVVAGAELVVAGAEEVVAEALLELLLPPQAASDKAAADATTIAVGFRMSEHRIPKVT